MANTVYGPYQATAWTNGVTAVNATHMANLETQASDALHGFNPSLIAAGFIFSGCACSGTVGTTTLNIASGVAFLVMTDGTIGQITVGATTQTTATPSSTYHLYVQPDGTFYWSTSNSPQTNSLALCTVATDGSGNISSVTDARVTAFTLFSGAAGVPALPQLSTDAGLVTTDGLGTLSLAAPAAPAAPSAATTTNTTTNTYSATVLGDSPLRYYRMDSTTGTETDHGSNAQNGTTHAAPTQSVTGALNGDTDTAYTFASASSQYVSAADTGLPSGNSAFSIEGWAKIASNPAALAIICSFGTSSSGAQAELYVDSSGRPNVAIFGGTAVVGSALSTGVWHHIVGTYDGSNERLYVDGTLVAGPTAPGVTVNLGTGGLAISSNVTPGSYFNGSIDEVAVYSTALSQTKVTNHYTIGIDGPDSQTTLGVGVYKYTCTFGTAVSETAQSSQASVTTTTGHQHVNLTSIPTGPRGTTKRKLYRTTLGGSTLELLTTLADNTTTSYTDSTPDSSLGAAQGTPNAGALSVAYLDAPTYVAGQATAGSFGVPVIVAQAINVAISATSTQTILSYTPPATGVYRVSAYYVFSNTGVTQNLTIKVNWTDPDAGGPTFFFSDGNFVYNAHAQGGPATSSLALLPTIIYAAAGSAITCQTIDSANTPSDHATFIIERLA